VGGTEVVRFPPFVAASHGPTGVKPGGGPWSFTENNSRRTGLIFRRHQSHKVDANHVTGNRIGMLADNLHLQNMFPLGQALCW
jgi:hypothetical protein